MWNFHGSCLVFDLGISKGCHTEFLVLQDDQWKNSREFFRKVYPQPSLFGVFWNSPLPWYNKIIYSYTPLHVFPKKIFFPVVPFIKISSISVSKILFLFLFKRKTFYVVYVLFIDEQILLLEMKLKSSIWQSRINH